MLLPSSGALRSNSCLTIQCGVFTFLNLAFFDLLKEWCTVKKKNIMHINKYITSLLCCTVNKKKQESISLIIKIINNSQDYRRWAHFFQEFHVRVACPKERESNTQKNWRSYLTYKSVSFSEKYVWVVFSSWLKPAFSCNKDSKARSFFLTRTKCTRSDWLRGNNTHFRLSSSLLTCVEIFPRRGDARQNLRK